MNTDTQPSAGIPSMEIIGSLLEGSGGWCCEWEPRDGLPGLLAEREDPATGSTRLRIVPLEDSNIEQVLRWSTDAPATTHLVLLVEETPEDGLIGRLIEEARRSGRNILTQPRSGYGAKLAGLPRIRKHYLRLEGGYLESEGEDFLYIDPLVVDEGEKRTSRLFDWTDGFERPKGKDSGGIVFIASDYGEGKTSFCLNYAFRSLKREESATGIPLFFPLSECDAGTLKDFLVGRLHQDYGLNLTFEAFVWLCRLGVYIPVLDAFDQMSHGAGGLRVERDRQTLTELTSPGNHLYCTCRTDFFNRYLKARIPHRLLLIRGFGDFELKRRLKKLPKLLASLTDPVHRPLLGTLPYKPLTLQIIIGHRKRFLELLEKRRSATGGPGAQAAPLGEYDLFELLFRAWLNEAHPGLRDDDPIALCRSIAAHARLDGMNVAVSLGLLVEEGVLAGRFASGERREALLGALRRLPLLDRTKLDAEAPRAVFRFNAYLEYLVARFVLAELDSPTMLNHRAFIRVAPLTPESRAMVASRLGEVQGEALRELIDATRLRHFKEVEYQGGNALTLILDHLQHHAPGDDERRRWRELLTGLPLRHAVLRALDARGADLSGLDLSHCDLEDADLSYATLRNVNLAHARLDGLHVREPGALLTTAFIRQEGAGGRWLLAGGVESGMLTLWRSESPYPRRSRPHREAITALELRPAGSAGPALYSASLDGALCSSTTDDLHDLRSYPLAMGSLRALAVTPDGELLAVAGDREFVQIRRADDGGELHRIPFKRPSGALVAHLALTSEGLIAGDTLGGLYRCTEWREEGGTFSSWGESLKEEIRTLLPLPTGDLLVLLVSGRVARLDAQGEILSHDQLEGGARAIAFAAEANQLLWLEGQRLWCQPWSGDIPGARIPFAQLPYEEKRPILAGSPDGRNVAVGGERLTVWGLGAEGVEVQREESMRMDCAGLILDRVTGLDRETIDFLKARGAVVS